MTNYDEDHHPKRLSWQLVLVAVLILLVGGVVGFGVRSWTSDTAVQTTGPTVTVTPTSPTEPTTTGTACTAAAETSAALLEQLEIGVRAIGDLDPAALRKVLDEMQLLQADLERNVEKCSGRIASATTTSTTVPPTTS